MPKWTEEQLSAINKEGSNIIVSAGAGSGKTAVLTERVIRKLKQGVQINNLLILTFTNAAAKEMKERIRLSIKKDPALVDQLDLIDGAYITTFDSFSLSLVKKYHYLLNLNKDINIADASFIYIKKSEIIDEIFDSFYDEEDDDFKKLVYTFCSKDDTELKKYILNINNKLDLLYDKEEYISSYLDEYYNVSNINEKVKLFEDIPINKIKQVNNLITELSNYVDSKYIEKLNSILLPLLNSKNYADIKNNLEIRLPNLPKNALEESKSIKESISNIIKELKSICIYSNNELIEGVIKTNPYVKTILNIIKILDIKLNNFKVKNNIYEFTDISKMAISIVENNKDVCLELKKLNEIMVDEYQDTSDLQERFISLIENNNVYMVGDIKQSIYRFRNANPYIFKNKYDNYSNGNNGIKIDLNKNFRSREETLNDINIIFNTIMDNMLGGADYKESHQMVFGNGLYLSNNVDSQNNHLEIYNYEYDNSFYSRDEIEAFVTATDIKNKINNNYKVFDKGTSSLRNANYSDFVILMDRSVKFDLYKKVFEYFGIPLTKYTDTSITDSDDVVIIKNVLGLIIKYKNKEFDTEFKYLLTSISRSYLFRYTDDYIFKMINENCFDNEIINNVKSIVYNYDNYSVSELVNEIIDRFNFYDSFVKKGDVSSSIIRLEYIYNLSKSFENIGYDIEGFYNSLSKLIEDNYSIDVQLSMSSVNSVKIMTIHKSKGLEFPICYYTGLFSKFNISDVKERFLFNKDLGIITPYFDEGIKRNFYYYLFKSNYLKEEISEKIRLFYVSLTRCREKMIIVAPLSDKTMDNLDYRYSYKSFLDMLNSVYSNISSFITDINVLDYNLTKDYDLVKEVNYKDKILKNSKKVKDIELNIKNEYIESVKYSKDNKELINKDKRNKFLYGEYIHYVFEVTDFKNPDYSNMSDEEKGYILRFLKCGLNFLDSNIYKEVEFVYNDKGKDSHGVIDLILEDDNTIKIIDYKLKTISEVDYILQLDGYKKYILSKTNKKIELYLYSIIDGELKEL